MSKQKNTEDLIKAINALREDFNHLADCIIASAKIPETKKEEAVPETINEEAPSNEEAPKEIEEKAPTFEEVRKVLAGVSSQDDGKYKAQVKELVAKYSSTGTLKGVPEESYAALVAEAEEIVNA